MRNILKLLKRDALRLLKTPAAMVVIIALLVLPSIYTWYNVLGFWDPYGNVSNIRVAVVNQDQGADSELTGQLNLGESVVDELKDDSSVGWWFTDYDTAMDELYSGKSYAVFVIPSDFSQNMANIVQGDFTKPTLQYYVNEKAGPVGAKLTDTGATTLEETINSSFVGTLASTVADSLGESTSELVDQAESATSSAVAKVANLQSDLNEARGTLTTISDRCGALQTTLQQVKSELDQAGDSLDTTNGKLDELKDAATDAQTKLSAITPEATEALQQCISVATDLATIAAAAGYGDQAQAVLTDLSAASQTLYGQTFPAINESLGQVATASASIQGAADNEKIVIEQAKGEIDQTITTLETARSALAKTDELISSFDSDLENLKSDIAALTSSDSVISLLKNADLDTDKISDFMAAPTELVTEKLYPYSCYGAAMAPLFMNLTFWIGAFMLLIIMRQEVDSEGVKNLTLGQRFLARYLEFGGMVICQAVICVLGVMALGVQVANPVALAFAAAISSLAFLAIIYTLSVLLQHIGKGIVIMLVFFQIPSASGIYPIEMTAPFYQAVYPYLPFTYGIRAMREGIAGFYGTTYLESIIVLLLFLFVFLILGLAFRGPLSNTNRMFALSIEEAGIFNGENVDLPVRQFRSSELLRTLISREDYYTELVMRYRRFMTWYPYVGRIAAVLAIAVPTIVFAVFSFTNSEKVVLLTIWLVLVIAQAIALVVIEDMRYRFERDMSLSDLSNEELMDLYAAIDSVTHANVRIEDTAAELGVTSNVSVDVTADNSSATSLEDLRAQGEKPLSVLTEKLYEDAEAFKNSRRHDG